MSRPRLEAADLGEIAGPAQRRRSWEPLGRDWHPSGLIRVKDLHSNLGQFGATIQGRRLDKHHGTLLKMILEPGRGSLQRMNYDVFFNDALERLRQHAQPIANAQGSLGAMRDAADELDEVVEHAMHLRRQPWRALPGE